ncbi:MAG TPA: sigma-70 family RNA polymerase sigma factor [Candidatus Saccharimonadales bacterium]|nr:sigma-70 family RNA polymerase sigma factor [Candidatus Saccharimonadales bacterium]
MLKAEALYLEPIDEISPEQAPQGPRLFLVHDEMSDQNDLLLATKKIGPDQELVLPPDIEQQVQGRRIFEVILGSQQKAQIVEANYGLIVKLASTYKLSNQVEFDELVQAGVVGLYKGIGDFDPRRSSKFGAYARWPIKDAMRDAIHDAVGTTERERRVYKALYNLEETLAQQLQRTPTINELHRACQDSSSESIRGINRQHIELFRYGGKISIPLNKKLDGGDAEIMDFIPEDEPTPEEIILRRDELDYIKLLIMRGLAELSEREAKVIGGLYGLGGSASKSQRKLGDELGISHARIGQIHRKALKKIGAVIGPVE